MDRVAIKYRFILFAAVIFGGLSFSTAAFADTLLFGFDSELMDPTCFLSSSNITLHTWKTFRWTAAASGDISYFKMRIIEPTDSDDDNFVWAIYDDNNGEVGTLKAYGSYQGYDWTAIGLGAHTFAPTDIITNLHITSGNAYWLVAYSRDIDASTYTSSASIRLQRGRELCAPGVDIHTTEQNEWLSTSAPPPPEYFTLTMNSYHAWSVWQTESPSDTVPPASPTGLSVF